LYRWIQEIENKTFVGVQLHRIIMIVFHVFAFIIYLTGANSCFIQFCTILGFEL